MLPVNTLHSRNKPSAAGEVFTIMLDPYEVKIFDAYAY
jgi:hypothetical protein